MTPASRRIRRRHVAAVVLALALLGVAAIWTNTLGVADRVKDVAHKVALFVDPPPDRPIEAARLITPRPILSPTASPEATPQGSIDPAATPPDPTPTPKPKPERVKVDVNLLTNPDQHFITEVDKDWCAVAGTQMVLALHGKADLSEQFQRTLAGRIGEWESRRDSLNGEWGPAAIVAALRAYGVKGYEVRAYESRADALQDAAHAIADTHAPVLLLAWRGAHTWVMTGFRADADPLLFDDTRVSGAYILDPWYPRNSSIWGQSDPPGTYQDASEMRRNYLPWKRPEGHYPDRDGLFIAVVPTKTLNR